jgi:hypothetical protein
VVSEESLLPYCVSLSILILVIATPPTLDPVIVTLRGIGKLLVRLLHILVLILSIMSTGMTSFSTTRPSWLIAPKTFANVSLSIYLPGAFPQT